MKKLVLVLGLIPALGFAEHVLTDEARLKMQVAMNKELAKQGMITPGSGVQVVSDDKIQMESWRRDRYIAESKEQAKNGYVHSASQRAHELMNFKIHSAKNSASMSENDTDLYKSPKDITFSYTYVGIPESEIKEYYGIAPAGAFVTQPQQGWTGAAAFFKSDFAHCAYTEKNIIPGQGGARISEEIARYDVNDKVTVVNVEGNENTGFLYNIFWFDTNFYRQLECATQVYSPDNLDKTIELAKKIDTN